MRPIRLLTLLALLLTTVAPPAWAQTFVLTNYFPNYPLNPSVWHLEKDPNKACFGCVPGPGNPSGFLWYFNLYPDNAFSVTDGYDHGVPSVACAADYYSWNAPYLHVVGGGGWCGGATVSWNSPSAETIPHSVAFSALPWTHYVTVNGGANAYYTQVDWQSPGFGEPAHLHTFARVFAPYPTIQFDEDFFASDNVPECDNPSVTHKGLRRFRHWHGPAGYPSNLNLDVWLCWKPN